MYFLREKEEVILTSNIFSLLGIKDFCLWQISKFLFYFDIYKIKSNSWLLSSTNVTFCSSHSKIKNLYESYLVIYSMLVLDSVLFSIVEKTSTTVACFDPKGSQKILDLAPLYLFDVIFCPCSQCYLCHLHRTWTLNHQRFR